MDAVVICISQSRWWLLLDFVNMEWQYYHSYMTSSLENSACIYVYIYLFDIVRLGYV